jgi:hypothetical protein
MRGGGFVIHLDPPPPGQADGGEASNWRFRPGDPPGEHPVTVTATDPTGGTVATTLILDVVDEVNTGIGLVADFPPSAAIPPRRSRTA